MKDSTREMTIAVFEVPAAAIRGFLLLVVTSNRLRTKTSVPEICAAIVEAATKIGLRKTGNSDLVFDVVDVTFVQKAVIATISFPSGEGKAMFRALKWVKRHIEQAAYAVGNKEDV